MNAPNKIDFDYADFPVAGVAHIGHGIIAKIEYEQFDASFANPREADNLGVMFCDHSRYNLGDDDAPDPQDQTGECPDCEGYGESDLFGVYRRAAYGSTLVVTFEDEDDAKRYAESRNAKPVDGTVFIVQPTECGTCEGIGQVDLSVEDYLRRELGARVILPLYLYDHSGLSMSVGAFSCPWDSGQVGVIFDTAESREYLGCDKLSDDDIKAGLIAEVEEYDKYLRGEIYNVSVERVDTSELDEPIDELTPNELAELIGDTIDSCGGFLGDEYAKEEASEMARNALSNFECERDEKLATHIETMPTMGV